MVLVYLSLVIVLAVLVSSIQSLCVKRPKVSCWLREKDDTEPAKTSSSWEDQFATVVESFLLGIFLSMIYWIYQQMKLLNWS